MFSPTLKGDNGYRYYTYLQSPTLEMLLTLRELGMSIAEIDEYLKHPSSAAFRKIVAEKTTEIDRSIIKLSRMKQLFMQKQHLLDLCEDIDLDTIEVVTCKEEYLIVSRPITGAYDEADFAVFLEHMKEMGDHRLFNNVYGSMIHVNNILNGNFESYECFFTKLSGTVEKPNLFLKPAGTYLRAFCKGDWDNLPQTYQRVIDYASTHQLELKGFSYEEGLNEIAISNIDEYITQIMILCEEKAAHDV